MSIFSEMKRKSQSQKGGDAAEEEEEEEEEEDLNKLKFKEGRQREVE
jgi:hypothetical protein